jgi:hypothetical protein
MTPMSSELDRLRRICDALVGAFEAHPETSRTDRCLISLDNGEGVTVEDRDERPSALTVQRANSPDGLWTARQVADHYAVTRDFVYAHANELGGIRLGAGPRPRLRFDPATLRERWAHVNELPPVARQRPRSAAKRRERLPPVDLIPFERDY